MRASWVGVSPAQRRWSRRRVDLQFTNLLALLQALFQVLPQPKFTTTLLTEAKDLLVGHALSEVFQGDAAHSANLRDGACGETCQQDSCGGIGDLGLQLGTGHGGADLGGGGRQAGFLLQQKRQGAQQRWIVFSCSRNRPDSP